VSWPAWPGRRRRADGPCQLRIEHPQFLNSGGFRAALFAAGAVIPVTALRGASFSIASMIQDAFVSHLTLTICYLRLAG
jgi:hypothetical protein